MKWGFVGEGVARSQRWVLLPDTPAAGRLTLAVCCCCCCVSWRHLLLSLLTAACHSIQHVLDVGSDHLVQVVHAAETGGNCVLMSRDQTHSLKLYQVEMFPVFRQGAKFDAAVTQLSQFDGAW